MNKIANYTTEVTAEKSAFEIQTMLRNHGAAAVSIRYGSDKNPSGLAFLINTRLGAVPVPFELPANVAAVEKLLLNLRTKKPETWHSDYKQVMQRVHDQAARVAWRILWDWVRAQLAIIETEMVTIDQVFLPYLKDNHGNTVYEIFTAGHLALTPGTGEVDGEFKEVRS